MGIHHRHSIRLKDYDYSQAGAYFVTICTHGKTSLFGDIVDGEMRLNRAGQIVMDTWSALPHHYPGLELDECIVMPNHVHGIIILVGAGAPACPDSPGRPQGVAPTMSLPDVVHRFKDRKSTRLNSSHIQKSRMPSSA